MADAKVVFEKVREYIVNQLPVKAEDVKLESRLIEDLGADSATEHRLTHLTNISYILYLVKH